MYVRNVLCGTATTATTATGAAQDAAPDPAPPALELFRASNALVRGRPRLELLPGCSDPLQPSPRRCVRVNSPQNDFHPANRGA